MSSSCNKCNKNLSEKSPGLQCSFCLNFFHARCASISKEQLSVFTEIAGCTYKCEKCRILNTTEKEPINYQDLLRAINALQLVVENLQKEIVNLKDEKTSDAMELIIEEINERHRKEKHVIIYSLPEDGTSNPRDKRAKDLQQATEIIHSISPNVRTDSIKVQRLGVSRGNKPAPLRVELAQKDDVFIILKNKNKLKELNFNVQISTDKTRLQREQLKKLIVQITERKNNGEDNLYIK